MNMKAPQANGRTSSESSSRGHGHHWHGCARGLAKAFRQSSERAMPGGSALCRFADIANMEAVLGSGKSSASGEVLKSVRRCSPYSPQSKDRNTVRGRTC